MKQHRIQKLDTITHLLQVHISRYLILYTKRTEKLKKQYKDYTLKKLHGHFFINENSILVIFGADLGHFFACEEAL